MTARIALLLPNTNTLSHLAQAFAVAEWLTADGWDCHIGLAARRHDWAAPLWPQCHVIPELWEPSGRPFPCLQWFADPAWLEHALRSQEQLIARLRPALIIGIFDFLSRVSAPGIPRLSINGHCMLPAWRGVLGFNGADTPVRRQQQNTLAAFWQFAANRLRPALQRRAFTPAIHPTELLLGDFNLIYEAGELCDGLNLPGHRDRFIGPIFWDGWDRLGAPPPTPAGNPDDPTILIQSGTLPAANHRFVLHLAQTLASNGAHVWFNTGHGGATGDHGRLSCRPLFAPQATLPRAHLVIGTGGIGGIYDYVRHQIPALILPNQPEQATNGLALAHHGCGRVIAPPLIFTGHPDAYPAALTDAPIAHIVQDMLTQRASFRPGLARAHACLANYDARHTICQLARSLT